MTREQLQKRKEKAVRFVRDVLHDSNRADEISDESLEDYADRRRIKIENRRRRNAMASKRELEERIQELEEINEDLEGRLDQITDLAAPEDDEQDGQDDEGE